MNRELYYGTLDIGFESLMELIQPIGQRKIRIFSKNYTEFQRLFRSLTQYSIDGVQAFFHISDYR